MPDDLNCGWDIELPLRKQSTSKVIDIPGTGDDLFPGLCGSNAVTETAACSDGRDNDGDGLIDLEDGGCLSLDDDDEYNVGGGLGGGPAAACNDRLDNDADGLVDLEDPGCQSRTDADEFNFRTRDDDGDPPACNDGVDNDGDGLVDLADGGCQSLFDDDETGGDSGDGGDGGDGGDDGNDGGDPPACSDGVDNDGDGLIDLADPGCSSPQDDDEFNAGPDDGDDNDAPQCSDGIDNDGDGLIDMADLGCLSLLDDDESGDGSDDGDGSDPNPPADETFFVRTDGGLPSQCNGRHDAAYTGDSDNCAWANPLHALNPVRLPENSTLKIRTGDYEMGFGVPELETCSATGRWSCVADPIPRGVTLEGDCTAPPKLIGVERARYVLKLDNSDNVTLKCLEITDGAECTEFHLGSNPSDAKCKRDEPPFGKWAPTGISASGQLERGIRSGQHSRHGESLHPNRGNAQCDCGSFSVRRVRARRLGRRSQRS